MHTIRPKENQKSIAEKVLVLGELSYHSGNSENRELIIIRRVNILSSRFTVKGKLEPKFWGDSKKEQEEQKMGDKVPTCSQLEILLRRNSECMLKSF